MLKRFTLLVSLVSFIAFTGCNHHQKLNADFKSESPSLEEDESEDQDGIREAQEMEFELTKDIKLGYIPKYRLIEATESEMVKSRSGVANKISALTWTERGPNSDAIGPSNGNTRGPGLASDAVTSGRVRALWYDLADGTNRTVWIGSVSGGLWKTNDITSTSSAAWSVVNDYFDNLAIGAICQDPTNTDIMYFGTGEKASSADRVQGGGIWKSTDHGVTWNLLANTITFTNVSQMICDASGNVYVATIGANGIQRSSNGGTSWTNITPSGLTTSVTEMKLSNTGRLHISCGYGNAGTSGYRFTDIPGTVTSAAWTAPTTTFPTAYNVEIAVAGNVLYALPSNASDLTPVIYKSTDGGDNWAATVTSPPSVTSEPSINTGQGWYDLAIGVDPANPNNVIAGGLNFYKSTNGGATWTQLTRWAGTSLMYVHADHHNVTWKNGQVLLGTDGGVFYSSDNGVTFTDRNDGLRLKQFYSCAIHPTTTDYFLAGAQDNGTHQLTSPGLGGSVEVRGGDGGFVHIDQDEPQYQFNAVTRSAYGRSVNGGATWSSITYSTTIGQFINPTDYDDAANIMYTSGNTGQYVRWENPQTGSTFTPVSIAAFNAASTRAITVSPYTPNRVFFGTFGGRVVKVDNANTNTPTATNITGSSMSLSNVSCVAIGTNDDNLLATFSNYGAIHVWVTNTGGGTAGWTNISGTGLPDIPVRWAMFYPEDNTKAMLATEMGIYETDLINGASTVWVRSNSFPSVKTNMLQYRRSDGTVLAATHGRGLWTAQVPLMPYVRFASNLTTRSEGSTALTSVCRNYTDYTLNMTIDQAPAGDANVSVLLAGGGTATQGTDFDFTTNGSFTSPSTTLVFANGATTPQPITIRIYNDAEIEPTESFTLSFTVGGATNALVAPSSSSHIFTITDNDVAPVAPAVGPVTAGTGSYGSYIQPFRSNFNNAKSQYIYLASELSAFGLNPGNIISAGFNVTSKTSTQPYTGLTIALKNTSGTDLSSGTFETGTTVVYSQNYSTVVGVNTFTFSSPFNWDGVSNILVEICYSNASATGSGDNVTSSITTPVIRGLWNRDNAITGCSLTGAFNAVGTDNLRPDIIFTGNKNNLVATVQNTSSVEYVNSAGTFNFFSGASIISQLSNVSANLDCVNSSVYEAGTTWQSFEAGQRSQKVIEINPTSNSNAAYTVKLYFSAAELAGKTPASLRIAKTTAPNMAAANPSNTIISPTTVTAYGSDYIFSADFSGFSKFFLVDNLVALPVELISFNGYLNNNGFSSLLWKTTNQLNLKNFEIQRSYDAVNFTAVGSVNALQNPATVQQYDFTDQLKAKAVNFYRLKMIDTDGRFSYSGIIKINNNKPDNFVEVLQNPVHNNISFIVENAAKNNIVVSLLGGSGQQIKRWDLGKQEGSILLPIGNLSLPSGVYVVKVSDGKKVATFRLTKQ